MPVVSSEQHQYLTAWSDGQETAKLVIGTKKVTFGNEKQKGADSVEKRKARQSKARQGKANLS